MKPKKKDKFEETRKKLLAGLVSNSKGKVITKVIPFTNNDVPNFLRKLKKFEDRSRKISLMVGD
jgi:hypothetical protein